MIFFFVASERGGLAMALMAAACQRASQPFAVFFTHDGVRALLNPSVVEQARHALNAVVCSESWQHWCGADQPCPVILGGQTTASKLAGLAKRVVSL